MKKKAENGQKVRSEPMTPLPILMDPDKFCQPVPVEKIVADRKVYKRGVRRYKRIIGAGRDIRALIVVKHPTKDLYAVLDGHHRFWAQKELGGDIVDCAIIQDYHGLIFYLTKGGFLQPVPKFTQYIRVPLIKWGAGLLKYLKRFLENPRSMFMDRPAELVETEEELEEDDLI